MVKAVRGSPGGGSGDPLDLWTGGGLGYQGQDGSSSPETRMAVAMEATPTRRPVTRAAMIRGSMPVPSVGGFTVQFYSAILNRTYGLHERSLIVRS